MKGTQNIQKFDVIILIQYIACPAYNIDLYNIIAIKIHFTPAKKRCSLVDAFHAIGLHMVIQPLIHYAAVITTLVFSINERTNFRF
jgi:hypothetical protein